MFGRESPAAQAAALGIDELRVTLDSAETTPEPLLGDVDAALSEVFRKLRVLHPSTASMERHDRRGGLLHEYRTAV